MANQDAQINLIEVSQALTELKKLIQILKTKGIIGEEIKDISIQNSKVIANAA